MCWEVMLERVRNVMTGAGETVIRRRVKVLESDSNSHPSSAMYNTCAKRAVLSLSLRVLICQVGPIPTSQDAVEIKWDEVLP